VQSAYCSTSAVDGVADVLDEIVETLVAMGIEVEQVHAEASPGQFEVVTTHGPALQAADRLLLTREVVHAVAARHGLLACFLPKPLPHAPGNGCHLHMSLWEGGVNLLGGGEACGEAVWEAFFAGVLHYLPALLAVTTPSINSFERLKPRCWSGGGYRCWGMDNKEAPLRGAAPVQPPVASSSSMSRSPPHSVSSVNSVHSPSQFSTGRPTHFELKAMDATANPHVAIAAVIAAGLLGVDGAMALPPPLQTDPADLSPQQRATAGVTPLPDSAAAAAEHVGLISLPLSLSLTCTRYMISNALLGVVRSTDWVGWGLADKQAARLCLRRRPTYKFGTVAVHRRAGRACGGVGQPRKAPGDRNAAAAVNVDPLLVPALKV
jgi:glutamine synthetase